MPNLETMRALAESYVETFNRHDLDGLAALFDNAVTLRDWAQQAQGKAAVLEANRAIFAAVPSIAATIVTITVEARRAAVELDIAVTPAERIKVLDILEFTPDGKLAAVRAYKG